MNLQNTMSPNERIEPKRVRRSINERNVPERESILKESDEP